MVEVYRADGSPAPQTLIRLDDLDGRGGPAPPNMKLTDAEGRGSFRELEPGRYRVTAQPIGGASGGAGSGESPEVLVVAGEESPVRIDLP